MTVEGKLQSEIISWLKSNGVYVIKTRVLPGVPVGCPDIIGLYGNRWLVIEVKASRSAKYRPGQQATLQRLREGVVDEGNRWVYTAYPENWPEIKAELAADFL